MRTVSKLCFILMLLSVMVACIPIMTHFEVAPSYEVITENRHDMALLLKDYDAVLAVIARWAEKNNGIQASCKIHPRVGFGQISPACTLFRIDNINVEVIFTPEINATTITILVSRGGEKWQRIKDELRQELVSAFGEQSILHTQWNN